MTTIGDPFKGVDWIDIHRRLLAVAVRLSALLSTPDKVLLGTGVSAEDLVNATILKALQGQDIRFHAARGGLFGLLKTAMLRDFLDLRRKRSHQLSNELDALESEVDGSLLDRAHEQDQAASMLLGDVRRLVQGDAKLLEYIEAIALGCEKPSEIAVACGVDVQDIYARRRRLKDKLAGQFLRKVAT